MQFVMVALLVAFLVWYLRLMIRRRDSIVAKRGMSVGADLAAMNAQPRVKVSAVGTIGPDRASLVLHAEDGADLEMVVGLRDGDLEMLTEWRDTASLLAMVRTGRHLIRLRAIESLQPLTLRIEDA
jgi:hypothetical protein